MLCPAVNQTRSNIGATGSGKSSFIKAVSDRDDIEIGHDLSSCELSAASSYDMTSKLRICVVKAQAPLESSTLSGRDTTYILWIPQDSMFDSHSKVFLIIPLTNSGHQSFRS